MRILIFTLLLSAMAGAESVLAAEKLNSVVAIVNNDSISRLEISRLISEARRRASDSDEEFDENLARKGALEALMFRALQLQHARRMGVEIPEEMVRRRLDGLREQFRAGDDNALRAAVRRNTGLSWDEFYARLIEDMEIEAVFYGEVFSRIEIGEEEADRFLRTESGLIGAREYRLRHLRIDGKTEESRAQIAELRRRIVEDGESFSELAREYSTGENADSGGDLQWRTAEQLPAPFAPIAEELAVGETGEIIETGRGFHLLQLTESRGGELLQGAARLRLAHIFLGLEEDDLAKDLISRLADGESFTELAARFSRDERSAASGGDLGWFPAANLPSYFAPLRNLQEGEVAEPLTSEFGIHLVRVDRREEIDLETARARAGEILREQRATEKRREWLNELRERAYVVVVDPDFAGLIDDNDGG